MHLVVRVDEVDGDGVAHGHQLAMKRRKAPPKVKGCVRAADLIDAGLSETVRRSGPLA